jgi:glycosyltransferase involved in cell wall biosynthesis
MGMHHDALVMQDALRWVYPDLACYSQDIPWNPNLDYKIPVFLKDDIKKSAPFDLVVHFEHLYGHAPLRHKDFARKTVFVPNIEWLMAQDIEEITQDPPDVVLYKNTFTEVRCETIACIRAIPARIKTGWTSQDINIPECHSEKWRRPSCLHVKGLSNQKQTSAVLKAWLENPDFPHLTIVASLHDDFIVPVVLSAAPNISFIFRKLPEEELRDLQNRSLIHIYPSLMEGFGHSLNEARACAAILLTTDGPPMNDFVTHGYSGYLIGVNTDSISEVRYSVMFPVSPQGISEAVKSVMRAPVAELRKVAKGARNAYVEDRLKFIRAIGSVFGPQGG